MAAALLATAAGSIAGPSLTLGAACEPTTMTMPVQADTWLDENSPFATKGSDSVLSVEAGSLNVDTAEVSGRARALVGFGLPATTPPGCILESARLRIYSSEETTGTRVSAVRLASAWMEGGTSWNNQPATTGPASTIWSRQGYAQWKVTAQVEAMLAGEPNHGFLIHDAAEGAETGGGGHGFYAREKGEFPPELVLGFGPPPTGEPPGPPAAPEPATVHCGQVLTASTLVSNDLAECPADGLVIGADRIIVDLDGHTVDGVGLGAGVLNDGYTMITVRNGTIQEFDYGVQLFPDTTDNVIAGIAFLRHQVAAVELFDTAGIEVLDNRLDQNGGGIQLVSGTRDSAVVGNTITANGGAGLLVRDSMRNHLEANSVSGGGDLGVGFERASDNTLLDNVVENNSDGGIEIRFGSHRNHVEGNVVTASGDTGIMVSESDGNELISNTAALMSDSGITLDAANDGVVRGNDVRFNTGGIQMDGSSRNLVEGNDTSNTSGIGIELGGGSYGNRLLDNVANGNGAQGIYVADEAILEPGNVLDGNTANDNLSDGIALAKGGHTVTANVTRDNTGWGISAAPDNIDGSRNVATGNGKPEQCIGVVCKVDWNPPETTIRSAPATATSGSTATFKFDATDDTSPGAALRFQCALDGAAFTACTSPLTYADLGHGSHTFSVRATDGAANTDPTPAVHAWTVDATPPDTTIDDAPADPERSTTATFAFSANEAGSTFACSLDAGPFEACSSPSTQHGLSQGAHTFEVTATDAAGNADTSPAAHTWTIDTTPPQTTITAGPADPTSAQAASFSFSADEAASFECSLDEAPPATCNSPVVIDALPEGRHTFRVTATDPAGNADPIPAAHTWTVDTTPPDTTIEGGPADPTRSTTAFFAVTSSETGSTFACALDAGAFAACTSAQAYSGLAEGSHTFRVVATDPAGNADPIPAAHAWTVDTTPPDTTIDSGPTGATSSTSATFAFSSSETGSNFACALDGATFTLCASPVTYDGLGLGAHTFEAAATDAAGNADPSPADRTWMVEPPPDTTPPDTTPPETTIESGPSGPTSSTNATLTFSATEAGSAFECSLDGAPFATCSSPTSYTGLADGSHTVRVAATDAAGNTDLSPASRRWTVDTTPPDTTIDSGPSGATNSTTATFTFSANEAATFVCALDSGSFVACTSPRTYSGLASGSHTFRVRATDAVGNTDPSPASRTWTVDTTAPQTTIDSGPSGTTTNRTATFTFSASEAGSTFQCQLDTAPYATCTSPTTHSGLAIGSHTFRVRATDPAGNTDGTPATRAWTVQRDTTPPQTTITSGPSGTVTSQTATFTFSASETGATFQCQLDSAAYAACTSPASYEELTNGTHVFRVRATDRAGNTDASPASRTWTVEADLGCGAPMTLIATADAWLEQNSPTSNKGADSVLKVRSKGPADNARALLRFGLPTAPPDGCVIESATLRLYSDSAKDGRTLQALGVTGDWTEGAVTWGNQPATDGAAATTNSGPHWRTWDVVAQVQQMATSGNNGFLIRDETENQDSEQSFHSREKGTNVPQLVITYRVAP